MQSANFTKQCPKHEDARRTLESDGAENNLGKIAAALLTTIDDKDK